MFRISYFSIRIFNYREDGVAIGGAGIFTGGFCAGSCASGLFTLRDSLTVGLAAACALP